jgi:choline dehydrogenase-like flavoprotein
MKQRSVTKTYDYIIIGAGAAGSIMAARLGENKNNKILILEAGHDNRLSSRIISEYDKKLESIPIKDGIYLRRYHKNPDKKMCGGLEASPSLNDYVTVKQRRDISHTQEAMGLAVQPAIIQCMMAEALRSYMTESQN